jgi:hypothetical protein
MCVNAEGMRRKAKNCVSAAQMQYNYYYKAYKSAVKACEYRNERNMQMLRTGSEDTRKKLQMHRKNVERFLNVCKRRITCKYEKRV